mgnify:CR=1 FL=1
MIETNKELEKMISKYEKEKLDTQKYLSTMKNQVDDLSTNYEAILLKFKVYFLLLFLIFMKLNFQKKKKKKMI